MSLLSGYCIFGNFREGFIFAKLRSFVKIKSSRIGEITLSFTDIGISCPSREILPSQVCLLTLFAKNKSRLQYFGDSEAESIFRYFPI